MTEHNRAIRMAQKMLRLRAGQFNDVENSNRGYDPHPHKQAYKNAAAELEALIEEQE